MNWIKAFLLVCVLITPAMSQDTWQCAANGGAMYQHQIIQLPQDADKCYCTIFGNPQDEQYQHLLKWFDENPDLRDLKQRTHFAALPSDSVMFRNRYSGTVDQLPCVRVQRPNGEVICQVSNHNLPLSAESLTNVISTNCLRRNATPSINYHYVYVMPGDKPDKQPDVYTDPMKAAMIDIPTWFYCVSGGLSLLIGVGIMFAKEYRKHGNGK